MKLLKLLGVLLLLLALSNCGSMQTSDFEVNVTLPASQECYGLHVMSGKETRRPSAVCMELKKRAVFLTSENYKLLKADIQRNCQNQKCKQITGAFDGLFLSLDEALRKIPKP